VVTPYIRVKISEGAIVDAHYRKTGMKSFRNYRNCGTKRQVTDEDTHRKEGPPVCTPKPAS